MTCRQHAGADNMQMTCACGRRADDMHITPGVVLHEIRQLRQEDGVQLCIKPNMASLLLMLLISKGSKVVFVAFTQHCILS